MISKEKTQKFLDSLFKFQENAYEKVENGEDVKVFNIIGTVIGLVNADYITYTGAFDFVKLLTVSNDVKQKVYDAYFVAIDEANKEEK